jgi:hypothetical protein
MQTTETSSKQSSTDLATMSGTIMLSCWVIGTPVGKQIFTVRVRHDGVWHDVKKAIKEEKKVDFNDIDADTLDLWKVRHCAISRVVAQLPIQKATIHGSQRSLLESEGFLQTVTTTNPLDPIDSLSTEFKVPLPDGHVNIIVVERPRRLCALIYPCSPHCTNWPQFLLETRRGKLHHHVRYSKSTHWSHSSKRPWI